MPDNVPIPQYQAEVYKRAIDAGHPPYIAELYANNAPRQAPTGASGGGDRSGLLAPLYGAGSLARGVVAGTGGWIEGGLQAASIPFDQLGNQPARDAFLKAAQATGDWFKPFDADPYESKRWSPEWTTFVMGSGIASMAPALGTAAALTPAGPVAQAAGAAGVLGHIERPDIYYKSRLQGDSLAKSLALYEASSIGTGALEYATGGRAAGALGAVKQVMKGQALRRVGKEALKTGAGESFEEWLQGRWQQAVSAYGGISKWSDLWEGQWEDIVGGFGGGSFMGAMTAQMENQNINKFLNSNTKIDIRTTEDGKKVPSISSTTEPTGVKKDENGKIISMIISPDMTKEFVLGQPKEGTRPKFDYTVTKTVADNKGKQSPYTQKLNLQPIPNKLNAASRRVVETALHGIATRLSPAMEEKKLQTTFEASELFNKFDPLMQHRLQNEAIQYSRIFNVPLNKVATDPKFKNHISQLLREDKTVYYTAKGKKSSGVGTLVNFKGEKLSLAELPAVLEQNDLLPREVEFASAYTPEATEEGVPITATLRDILFQTSKGYDWTAVEKRKAEIAKKAAQSTTPSNAALRMFSKAGVKPTTQQMSQPDVIKMAEYWHENINRDQIEQKLVNWFKPKKKRGEDRGTVTKVHQKVKSVEDKKDPDKLKTKPPKVGKYPVVNPEHATDYWIRQDDQWVKIEGAEPVDIGIEKVDAFVYKHGEAVRALPEEEEPPIEAYEEEGEDELFPETEKIPVITGDIWQKHATEENAYVVVSTNLGGVHGRGLAKQAKDKKLITKKNVDFNSSPVKKRVFTIAVKGRAPETQKIRGQAYSEQTVAGNLDLMKKELTKLNDWATKNPESKVYVPFIGLGFGEGNPDEINQIYQDTLKSPNITLVSRDSDVIKRYKDSFKPGVRSPFRAPKPEAPPKTQVAEEWRVVEGSTGLPFSTGATKEDAINEAKTLVSQDPNGFLQFIYKRRGMFGLSPRYTMSTEKPKPINQVLKEELIGLSPKSNLPEQPNASYDLIDGQTVGMARTLIKNFEQKVNKIPVYFNHFPAHLYDKFQNRSWIKNMKTFFHEGATEEDTFIVLSLANLNAAFTRYTNKVDEPSLYQLGYNEQEVEALKNHIRLRPDKTFDKKFLNTVISSSLRRQGYIPKAVIEPVETVEDLANVPIDEFSDRVDMMEDMTKRIFYQTGALFKRMSGVIQPPAGLSRSEVARLWIEHERIHAGTGIGISYDPRERSTISSRVIAAENLVTALALERIGRPDLAQLYYNGMMQYGQIKEMPDLDNPVNENPNFHDAAVNAFLNLKTDTIKTQQPKAHRKGRKYLFNPSNKKVITTDEDAIELMAKLMHEAGISEMMTDEDSRLFVRNLADFLTDDITMEDIENIGLPQSVVEAFQNMKQKLTKAQAMFVIQYLDKIGNPSKPKKGQFDKAPGKPKDTSNIFKEIYRAISTVAGRRKAQNAHQIAKVVVDWVAEGNGNYQELSESLIEVTSSRELIGDIHNVIVDIMMDRKGSTTIVDVNNGMPIAIDLNRNTLNWKNLIDLTRNFIWSYMRTKEVLADRGHKWRPGEVRLADRQPGFYRTIERFVKGEPLRWKGRGWWQVTPQKLAQIKKIKEFKDAKVWVSGDYIPKVGNMLRFSPKDRGADYADFIVTGATRRKFRGEDGWTVEGFRMDTSKLKRDIKADQNNGFMVISGGQTGVDQLALETAKSLRIGTGGTAPLNFMTSAGKDPSLAKKYGLVEIAVSDQKAWEKKYKKKNQYYPPRTEKNVIDSDATIYFNEGKADSTGLKLTRGYAKEHNKKFLVNPTPEDVVELILDENIKTLNVAGNRKISKGFEKKVQSTLESIFETLDYVSKYGRVRRPAISPKIVDIFGRKTRGRYQQQYPYQVRIGNEDYGSQLIEDTNAKYSKYEQYRTRIVNNKSVEGALEIFKEITGEYRDGNLAPDIYLRLLESLKNFKTRYYAVKIPWVPDVRFNEALNAGYVSLGGTYALQTQGIKFVKGEAKKNNPDDETTATEDENLHYGRSIFKPWEWLFTDKDAANEFREFSMQGFQQIGLNLQDNTNKMTDYLIREAAKTYSMEENNIKALADSYLQRGFITKTQHEDIYAAFQTKDHIPGKPQKGVAPEQHPSLVRLEKYFELDQLPNEWEKQEGETWRVDHALEDPVEIGENAPNLELGQFQHRFQMLYKMRGMLSIWDSGQLLKKWFTKEEMAKHMKWSVNRDTTQEIVATQKEVESRMGQVHNLAGLVLSERLSRYMLDWRSSTPLDNGETYTEEQAKNWWNQPDESGYSFAMLFPMVMEEFDNDPTVGGNNYFFTDTGEGYNWMSESQKRRTIEMAQSWYKYLGALDKFNEKDWETGRPKGAFWNVLPRELKNYAIFNKKILNILGDARTKNGLMEDVNVTANKLKGYMHRKAIKELHQRGGGGYGGMGAFGSTYEPQQEHYSYADYMEEVVKAKLEPPGFDFLMGEYVKTSLDFFLMKQMTDEFRRIQLDSDVKKTFNIPDDPTFGIIVYENDINRYIATLPKEQREAWMQEHARDVEVLAQFDRYQGVKPIANPKPSVKAVMTAMGYRKFNQAPGMVRYAYNSEAREWGMQTPWVHASIYKLLEDLHADKTVDSLSKIAIRFNSLIKRWVMHNPYLYLWNIIAMPTLQLVRRGQYGKAWEHIIKPLPKIVPGQFWLGGAAGAVVAGTMFTPIVGALASSAIAVPLGFQLGSWAGLLTTKRAKRMLKGLEDSFDFLKTYTSDELDELVEAATAGLNAANTAWMQRSMWHETAIDKEKSLNMPTAGLIGELFQTKAGLDNEVFSKYVTRVLFETYKSFRDMFLERGVDPYTARRMAASMSNNFGGTLQGNLYGRFENYARLWQFATDFQDTFFRMVTGASWPVWNKLWGYRPGGINVIFHGEARRKEMQASWKEYAKLLSMAAFWKFLTINAITFALSMFNDDDDERGKFNLNVDYFNGKSKDLWNVAPGMEMSIKTGYKDSRGNEWYIDPVFMREPNQLGELFYSKMRRDYRFTPQRLIRNMMPLIGDYWNGREAAVFQLMRDLYNKKDFFGNPIADDPSDFGMIKGWGMAALQVGLPLYARPGFQSPEDDPVTMAMTRLMASVGVNPKMSRYSTMSPYITQQQQREAIANVNFRKQVKAGDMAAASPRELGNMLDRGEITAEQYRNAMARSSSDRALNYRWRQNPREYAQELLRLRK